MSALHRFLVEFDLDAPSLPRGAWPLLGRDPLPAGDEPEPEPESAEPGFSEPATDPIAEAVAAALAEAGVAHAAELAEIEGRHAAEMAEVRATWAKAEGAFIAQGLGAAMAAQETALAEGVAAVLEPLLSDALRVAAVAELRTAIADLVLAGTGGTIAVSGPQDLLDALRDAMRTADLAEGGMTFTAAEAAEVTVTADNSAIETRLGAWTRALRRRLEDKP